MSLARVIYVIGVFLMIWALVSGINLSYEFYEGEGNFTSGYSFKIGLFLLGLLMVYLGRKSRKESSS
jgi:hypothetical protein